MCAHALNLVRVPKVVFGCKNDKFGGQGSILSLHKLGDSTMEVKSGLMEKEAIEIL